MTKHIQLLLLLFFLSACHPGSNENGSSPAATQAEAAASRSPRYHADSLRTLGRAWPLYDEHRDREAIPYLDSIFLLPACIVPGNSHPDSLGTAEARHLCNQSLRHLMAAYNILIDFEGGLRHLDSLQRLHIPFVERYCLRGLLTAKAQMLMPLNRHAEALECLNRAMQLAETEDSIAGTLPGSPARSGNRLSETDGLLESPEYDSYWSAAAGITYMGVDTLSTRDERAFLRVIDIARRTGFRDGLYPHAMARLADIYLHQGKYEQSIALCREAIATATPGKADDQGIYVAAENLTETYRRLGLYEDALRYCALVTDAPNDYEILNNLRGRSYQRKGAILAEMNRPAEALTALAQADSCFDRTGNDYYKLYVALERTRLLSTLPDSLPHALQLFSSFRPRVKPHCQGFYHYYYGEALVRAGQHTAAIPLLKDAVPELEDISERLMACHAARLLTECYRQSGQYARLAELLPRYHVLADSVASDAKIRQLASANIRFETEKKEQENRALAAEVALKDSRLRTSLLVGALCLLAALAATVWGVMRQRTTRLRQQALEERQQALDLRHQLDKQEKESAEKEKLAAKALLHEQEQQLQQLILSRQQLNDRNRELVRQLSEIQSSPHNSLSQVESLMKCLQKNLLTKDEAERLRNSFSALYPTALYRLRTACPDVSPSEELFCILVVLKQKNEGMARTLGIDVRSVTKIRYRLRLKLKLPEGAEVDAEVKKIMEEEIGGK